MGRGYGWGQDFGDGGGVLKYGVIEGRESTVKMTAGP